MSVIVVKTSDGVTYELSEEIANLAITLRDLIKSDLCWKMCTYIVFIVLYSLLILSYRSFQERWRWGGHRWTRHPATHHVGHVQESWIDLIVYWFFWFFWILTRDVPVLIFTVFRFRFQLTGKWLIYRSWNGASTTRTTRSRCRRSTRTRFSCPSRRLTTGTATSSATLSSRWFATWHGCRICCTPILYVSDMST